MPTQGNRLIVVSNRLPLVLSQDDAGHWQGKSGSGGLVSALLPVLRHRGGIWVGWPGTTTDNGTELGSILDDMTRNEGYTFQPVSLTAEEETGFYLGFANEIIWPLFHDLPDKCNFKPDYWHISCQVSRKFATAVAEINQPGDFIWVHDYHLMRLATDLRAQGVKSRIGFFLHIPFPPLDLFLKLPWRFDILRDLLEFDLIGFQTLRDRRNFLHCVRTLFQDVSTHGSGPVLRLGVADPALARNGQGQPRREIRVGSFPISIDYKAFASHAARREVKTIAERLTEGLHGCQMILGVDRLDYSKGLPNRLEAFRVALRRYPDELCGQIILSQHVVPSRADIPEYQYLLSRIERLVSEINGEFTQPGWVPIHYFYHNLPRDELIAYYRAAHMVLVTSLKDGMNLVAKEYCAAQVDENGVLILSEFAGAVAQLQNGALLINPHDLEGTADQIYAAFTMKPSERRNRMRKLRRKIRENDIFHWVDSFLSAAIDKDLSHFPVMEDYIPSDVL